MFMRVVRRPFNLSNQSVTMDSTLSRSNSHSILSTHIAGSRLNLTPSDRYSVITAIGDDGNDSVLEYAWLLNESTNKAHLISVRLLEAFNTTDSCVHTYISASTLAIMTGNYTSHSVTTLAIEKSSEWRICTVDAHDSPFVEYGMLEDCSLVKSGSVDAYYENMILLLNGLDDVKYTNVISAMVDTHRYVPYDNITRTILSNQSSDLRSLSEFIRKFTYSNTILSNRLWVEQDYYLTNSVTKYVDEYIEDIADLVNILNSIEKVDYEYVYISHIRTTSCSIISNPLQDRLLDYDVCIGELFKEYFNVDIDGCEVTIRKSSGLMITIHALGYCLAIDPVMYLIVSRSIIRDINYRSLISR